MVGGSALKLAADAIVEKARPLAAHLMEAAAADIAFKDGKFQVAGTDRAMPLVEVAKAFYRPIGLPKQFGVGLEASGAWSRRAAELPERLPRLRGRDRPGDRRGRASTATPWSTTSAASSTR